MSNQYHLYLIEGREFTVQGDEHYIGDFGEVSMGTNEKDAITRYEPSRLKRQEQLRKMLSNSSARTVVHSAKRIEIEGFEISVKLLEHVVLS